MPIDDADIQWLLAVAEAEDLAEIEVHAGDDEVLVRRVDVSVTVAAPIAGMLPTEAAQPVAPALPPNAVPVGAPMSGVFYRAPSPESPPYVEPGQEVVENDTVGLIEAMKLFNDVHAPVSGKVLKILVENEEQVEAGQALMLIVT